MKGTYNTAEYIKSAKFYLDFSFLVPSQNVCSKSGWKHLKLRVLNSDLFFGSPMRRKPGLTYYTNGYLECSSLLLSPAYLKMDNAIGT